MAALPIQKYWWCVQIKIPLRSKHLPNPFGAYLNLRYKLDREENIRVKTVQFQRSVGKNIQH